MATATTTIEDQLRALVRLQIIDSKIDQLTKLRGDLPDEIRDLEDERIGLQTRLGKIDQDKKEAEVQKKKLKLDIAESEGLIRKYEEQQLQVRNNREYDALTKEIEAHRQRIQTAYEEIERYREALTEFSHKDQLLLRARLEGTATFAELAEQLGYGSSSAARRAFHTAQAHLAFLLEGKS